jgi:hypothetical protein
MTAGRALVEPGGSYSPISTGWQKVPLKISKASDGLLRETRNQDVSSTVFPDHQVS